MVSSTLKLGISILNGGNCAVQQVNAAYQMCAHILDIFYVFSATDDPESVSVCVQRMLDYLKDKKDVGFFLSVQALMQTCRFGRNSQLFTFPVFEFLTSLI